MAENVQVAEGAFPGGRTIQGVTLIDDSSLDLSHPALTAPTRIERELALRARDCPAEIAAYAYRTATNPGIRYAAAYHPALSAALLRDIVLNDPVPTVRQAALANPACPADAVAHAARPDASWRERHRAFQHPACPLDVLERAAAHDPEPSLRRTARGAASRRRAALAREQHRTLAAAA